MEDFEAFKQSRVKMDPTSRKLTDHQWRKAYEANQRARDRLSGSFEGSPRQRRRSSSSSHSGQGQHQPSTISELSALRNTVRQQSAYQDIRMALDLVSWSGVVLVVLAAAVSLTYYSSTLAIVALLEDLAKVAAILFIRFIGHVIVDIPDVALYRELKKSSDSTSPALGQDSLK